MKIDIVACLMGAEVSFPGYYWAEVRISVQSMDFNVLCINDEPSVEYNKIK